MPKVLSFTVKPVTKLGLIVAPLLIALSTPALAQRLDTRTNINNGGSGQALERIAAIVNSDVVLTSEVDAMMADVQRNMSGKDTQLPPERILRKQIMEQLIISRLQLQLAERTGIKIDDDVLNEAMKNIAEQNKLSLSAFADKLARENIEYRQFREQVRDDIAIKQLQRRELDRRVSISDREVDDFIASMTIQGRDLREYDLKHILIAGAQGGSQQKRAAAKAMAEELRAKALAGADFGQLAIENSAGQNALQGGALGWRKTSEIPSLFATAVSRLNKGQISQVIASPSGYHIVKVADLRDSNPFRVTENQVRHILVKPTSVRANDEARAQAQELRNRIQRGESFSELARQYSDDPGSGVKGGDLGWSSPGQFVPEFEEVVEALQVGELSPPVRSRYGWHLIELQERRERDGTDQARRNQARKILGKRKSQEELELWLRRLRDEAYVEMLAES